MAVIYDRGSAKPKIVRITPTVLRTLPDIDLQLLPTMNGGPLGEMSSLSAWLRQLRDSTYSAFARGEQTHPTESAIARFFSVGYDVLKNSVDIV